MGGVMSSIVVSGDTSGAITIAAPSVAGTNTLTLPANTGTILTTASTFGATGPAFSAYLSTNQTITTGTDTKIQFNTELFDTANCYDNSTNYRFTPTVAGYYQFTVSTRDATGATLGTMRSKIFKNNTETATCIVLNNVNGMTASVTNLIYMNGTTDYVEGFVFQNSGSNMSIQGVQYYTYFSGTLVRGA